MSNTGNLKSCIAVLLLSGSTGLHAADDAATAASAEPGPAKGADVRKVPASRRGPVLDDAAGMVYVMTPEDIRRSGATTIRPVPGLDVVGRFEGSGQAH